MMRKIFLALLVAGVLGVGTAFATCTVEPSGTLLSQLVANPSQCLVVGDKVFYDFTFAQETSPISDATITVTTFPPPVAFDGGEGVQFNGDLGINNTGGTSATSFDFSLGYSVLSTAGATISGISDLISAGCLNLNTPNHTCTSTADVSVTETATGPGPAFETANSTVSLASGVLHEPPTQGTDVLTFGTPVPSVVVVKDVSVNAGIGDNVSFSVIQQDFQQVPEPGSYALVLGLGIACMVWRKRAAAKA